MRARPRPTAAPTPPASTDAETPRRPSRSRPQSPSLSPRSPASEAEEPAAEPDEQAPGPRARGQARVVRQHGGQAVTLPALGESVTEGTVTQWLKSVGDTVEVDEPLLEISTDKVDTEIPSPIAGTLLEIKVDEDETVEVGAELAIIGEEGAAPAASEPEPEPEPEEEAPAEEPSPSRARGRGAEGREPKAEEPKAEEPEGRGARAAEGRGLRARPTPARPRAT